VTRWLAGTFDPRGRADPSRLASALEPYPATIAGDGQALRIAYTGSERDSQIVLCLLDGFLDNTRELSLALEIPINASPEDVLAAGYRRWGQKLPARMRGDFVLLVWDHERHEGLLARDQLGVRSLFLHDAGGSLCFAGEIHHLLALLPQQPAPDPVSVAHWIAMSNRPGATTMYAGIRRLKPGAMLLLGRDGVREQPYWTPRFAEPLSESEPQLLARTRAALDCAIDRRIAPEGLTGVLMSGGLDSASVAAVATVQAPNRVSAYSGVFPEHPEVDESALIEELRGRLGLGGITAEVRAGGMLASVLEYVGAWDTPPVGWGEFWSLPLLRAAAAAGVTITLGGDGGDELFGCRAYLLADRLRAGHPLQAVRLARELPGAGDRPGRRAVARMAADFAIAGALPYHLHKLARGPFAGRLAPGWLRPQPSRDLHETEDPLAWKRMDAPRWWAEIAHGLTRGIEEVGLFAHQRRRAASAGLEARHPLFDMDLVELCLRQPPLASFDRYRSRPVLRGAMAGLLPDTVRLRPQKALFDSVLIDSLTGPDSRAVQTLLSNPAAELAAYLNIDELQRTLLDGGPRRASNPFRWMYQVWRLVTAECWLRTQAGTGGETMSAELRASEPCVQLRSVSP
jgi:asparagine synthase (glutamine-hydrolysing)